MLQRLVTSLLTATLAEADAESALGARHIHWVLVRQTHIFRLLRTVSRVANSLLISLPAAGNGCVGNGFVRARACPPLGLVLQPCAGTGARP